MKMENEKYLWDNFELEGLGKPFPRDVIKDMVSKEMLNSPKQAWRTLEKWVNKGWYDYGSCLDLGWKKQ